MDNHTKNQKFLASEAGQGTVEYILIMVVMVGVIFGILIQFNRAFETYANNLFGEYLTCLLETGELPSLGSTEDSSSVCAEFFSPFEPSGASLNLSGEGSGGGGGAAGSDRGDRGRGDDLDGRERQNRLSEANRGGGRGGSGSRGRGRRFSSGRGGRGRGPRDAGGAGRGDKDGIYTGDTGVSSDSFSTGRSGAPAKFATYGKGSDARFSSKRQDEERKKPILVKNKKVKSKNKGSSKVFKVDRIPAGSDKIKADGSSFGFGSFLRWLLIAAIIIAIVLFFGGQALQISKSMD